MGYWIENELIVGYTPTNVDYCDDCYNEGDYSGCERKTCIYKNLDGVGACFIRFYDDARYCNEEFEFIDFFRPLMQSFEESIFHANKGSLSQVMTAMERAVRAKNKLVELGFVESKDQAFIAGHGHIV